VNCCQAWWLAGCSRPQQAPASLHCPLCIVIFPSPSENRSKYSKHWFDRSVTKRILSESSSDLIWYLHVFLFCHCISSSLYRSMMLSQQYSSSHILEQCLCTCIVLYMAISISKNPKTWKSIALCISWMAWLSTASICMQILSSYPHVYMVTLCLL